MTPPATARSAHTGALRRRRTLIVVMVLVLAAAALGIAIAATRSRQDTASTARLPVTSVGQIGLPGDRSRFDYESLDPGKGLLFIAHLGASEIIEVDITNNRVIRTIPGVADVHGVLVVPQTGRVYATATGANQMITLDEATGDVLARSPTGDYPDGLAYDPTRKEIWTTNETGGSETVIDAATGHVRGTVDIGGQAGNVAYDTASRKVFVDDQTHNRLDVIDPATLQIVHQAELPGCDHAHGLTLATTERLAFVACDANATLLTIDLNSWQVLASDPVGADPDVLGFDPKAHQLYVAAESGTVSVFTLADRRLTSVGSGFLADGAHVVAVNPATHHSYYPGPAGPDGTPALLIEVPTT